MNRCRVSASSTIEWTEATWNLLRGCTKVSPGCKHCYAERFAERFRGVEGHAYERGFDLRLVPEKLAEPLRWASPKLVFVNSMSDLFHERVPDDYIESCVRVMELANWHTYQVLTKRAERLRELLTGRLSFAATLKNVWWGVSAEDRKYGLPRIDTLRDTPAEVRFLSIEPLLEGLGELDLTGIKWVIVGGESGGHARPMDPAWVRDIRDQCAASGVKFFFKQWGGVQKSKNGRLLDGRTYDDMPERTNYPVPSTSDRRAMIAQVEANLGVASLQAVKVKRRQMLAVLG